MATDATAQPQTNHATNTTIAMRPPSGGFWLRARTSREPKLGMPGNRPGSGTPANAARAEPVRASRRTKPRTPSGCAGADSRAVDASVDRIRWGVEIDVYPTHFTEEGGSNDRERDLACDAIGWRVSRVARPSLKRDFNLAIDRLLKVYERRCGEQIRSNPR